MKSRMPQIERGFLWMRLSHSLFITKLKQGEDEGRSWKMEDEGTKFYLT
jgi:hypothetical protein